MSDGPKPPKMNVVGSTQYKQAQKFLPGLARTIAGTTPVIEQGKYNAAAQVSPQYASLDLMLKDAFGQKESDANAKIADANIRNLTNIQNTSGRDLASSNLELSKIADPEYYRTRETLSNGINSLVNGQDPNKLTDSELENATRGVNRTNIATGNVNPSQTQTISNALTFGDELSKKRNQFSQALATATGALPTLKSGANPAGSVAAASGGLGDTSFAGVKNVGESGAVNGAMGNLYNSSTAANTAYANNRDYRGDFERIVGSLPDYSG
jgi:hypothetical protein